MEDAQFENGEPRCIVLDIGIEIRKQVDTHEHERTEQQGNAGNLGYRRDDMFVQ
jgi:hypothetical protein